MRVYSSVELNPTHIVYQIFLVRASQFAGNLWQVTTILTPLIIILFVRGNLKAFVFDTAPPSLLPYKYSLLRPRAAKRGFMTKKIINSSRAPKAIGPYSQAVEDGGFIFTSSVLPIDPVTGEIFSGDVQVQTEIVLKNMENILKEAGCSLKHVIKTTVFMTDLTKFAEMNAMYETFFKENPPARTTVQVVALPKGGVVQIEAIAKK